MTGFVVPSVGLPYIAKDPDAVLDYELKWDDWLGSDTITAVEFAVPTGLVRDSQAITSAAKRATVWLSDGVAGQTYTVTCHITTAGGREDDRSFDVQVDDR